MYEQMEDVVLRYEELMRLLASPGAADDSNNFKRLMKEQGDLAPIVEVYKAYKTAENDVLDAQKLLSDEKDPDMIELEREELSGAKERLLSYEKQLQIFLLPKDKNDDRDVVLEIRAGAGGEEAVCSQVTFTGCTSGIFRQRAGRWRLMSSKRPGSEVSSI